MPLGVSAVTVGFGYVVAFDGRRARPARQRLLLVAAQAVVAVPFVVRLVEPVLSATGVELRSRRPPSGASPWQAARDVVLPVASRAILGAVRSRSPWRWGSSARPRSSPGSTRPRCRSRSCACSRSLGAASVGQAMAMSVVLMAVTATITVAIDRFRVGSFGRI